MFNRCKANIPIIYLAGIYLLKVNNRNTKTNCEICSKLTIKTLERRYWRRSGVFIVNIEHISHLVLVASVVTFEHVILGWVIAVNLLTEGVKQEDILNLLKVLKVSLLQELCYLPKDSLLQELCKIYHFAEVDVVVSPRNKLFKILKCLLEGCIV